MLIVQGTGWAEEPVWTGAENFSQNAIRSPDHPVRSECLHRLWYAVWRGGGCYLLSSLLLTRVTRCKPCIKQCPLFVHCLQVRLYGNWLGVKDKEGGKREQKRNKMSTKCHTNEYILRVQLPLKIQREVSSFVTEAVNLAFLFASHLPLLHLRPIYVFSKGRVALDTSIKCWANSYIVWNNSLFMATWVRVSCDRGNVLCTRP